jgi:hypothetical protein
VLWVLLLVVEKGIHARKRNLYEKIGSLFGIKDSQKPLDLPSDVVFGEGSFLKLLTREHTPCGCRFYYGYENGSYAPPDEDEGLLRYLCDTQSRTRYFKRHRNSFELFPTQVKKSASTSF